MEKIKNIRKKLRHQRSVRRRKLGLSTPTQIICVSFIAVIALGTLLLTLPIASRHGRLDVLNAMFTATSATCVTGLVVVRLGWRMREPVTTMSPTWLACSD